MVADEGVKAQGVRVPACKPPVRSPVCTSSSLDRTAGSMCGFTVVWEGKSLSGNDIFPDLTLSQRAVADPVQGPHRTFNSKGRRCTLILRTQRPTRSGRSRNTQRCGRIFRQRVPTIDPSTIRGLYNAV
jgi:hypothetical protein